jgi:hypothetical protein
VFRNTVQSLRAHRVKAVATFQIPETIEAAVFAVVEVLVWIVDWEPTGAEIAEMSIALAAAHVVATHKFLAGHVAGRTRRCVESEIFVGGLFFLGPFCDAAGVATD